MSDTNKIVVSPPPKPITPRNKITSFDQLHKYLSSDQLVYFTEFYKHAYFIWQRTGGYSTNSTGLLSSQYNNIGNVDSSENDLLKYNIVSNTLDNSGSYLEVDAYGSFASNSNNKEIKFYLGSNLIFDSSLQPVNSGNWNIQIKIIRIDSGSSKVIYSFNCDNLSLPQKQGSLIVSIDLTIDQLFKCTGIGSVANDVIQSGMFIKIFHIQ